MTCPLGKKDCQGCPYQKERLCDYPYKVGMDREQIKKVTEKHLTESYQVLRRNGG